MKQLVETVIEHPWASLCIWLAGILTIALTASCIEDIIKAKGIWKNTKQ